MKQEPPKTVTTDFCRVLSGSIKLLTQVCELSLGALPLTQTS